MLKILCYKNQGIHWYHFNPTFLWKFNFTLVQRQISALIWDISGLWNRSDGPDFREKRIDISRFLALYIFTFSQSTCYTWHVCLRTVTFRPKYFMLGNLIGGKFDLCDLFLVYHRRYFGMPYPLLFQVWFYFGTQNRTFGSRNRILLIYVKC